MSCLNLRLPRAVWLLAALSLSAAMPAWADPPGRVGRISFAEGALSLQHEEDPQWQPAALNYPLIAGDKLWADESSRGEIEIGGAEARLDSASLLILQRLDEGATILRVEQGVANVTVRYLPPGGLQLVTAVGQMDIRQPGEYHVDAGRPNGPPTQLLMGTINGDARFEGLRGFVEIHAGQGAMAPPDQSQLTVVAVYPTPFDQWAEDRAASLQASQTVRYVSYDVTGYQDLDAYGRWETVPEYGAVWFPTRIDVGWAPYRHGHWAFIRPWGWTWIDEAPWGFAPFHYGRWAQFDGRWAWLPGARSEPVYYAPSLVAFIGGGPGIGVGWVPLGPREVFHPYYPVSDGYLRGINRAHVTNVTQINVTVNNNASYANRAAVTSVSAETFTGGGSVRRNMVPMPTQTAGGQPTVLTNLNHLQPAAAQAAQPAPQPGAQPRNFPGGPQSPPHPVPANVTPPAGNRPAAPYAAPPAAAAAPVAPTQTYHPAAAPAPQAIAPAQQPYHPVQSPPPQQIAPPRPAPVQAAPQIRPSAPPAQPQAPRREPNEKDEKGHR